MPFYDPRDTKAHFTGFGLSTPEDNEPEDDPDFEPEVSPPNEDLAPLANKYGLTVDLVEDMWAWFDGNQVFVNLANVAVAIVYFFAVHAALRTLSVHLAEADVLAQFTVMYQPIIWWGVAGIGGFCLAWEITIQIWSFFTNRTTIRLYREWVKQATFEYKSGFFRNQLRFWHWCAALLVLPVTLASILALNMHCLLGPSNMRVCGYGFKPCESLDYSAIQHVEFYPSHGHGEGWVASKVIVKFAGGRKWDSSDWFDGDVDMNLVRFLYAKDPDRVGTEFPFQSAP